MIVFAIWKNNQNITYQACNRWNRKEQDWKEKTSYELIAESQEEMIKSNQVVAIVPRIKRYFFEIKKSQFFVCLFNVECKEDKIIRKECWLPAWSMG